MVFHILIYELHYNTPPYTSVMTAFYGLSNSPKKSLTIYQDEKLRQDLPKLTEASVSSVIEVDITSREFSEYGVDLAPVDKVSLRISYACLTPTICIHRDGKHGPSCSQHAFLIHSYGGGITPMEYSKVWIILTLFGVYT